MPGHSIIVLGASAGGLAPLKQILAALPRDLAASLFVVVHIAPRTTVDLARGLRASCRMDVAWAQDGESIRNTRVYLAPPNRHLLVKRDRVRVLFGARENRVRPAADVLFRSAAVSYGSRVVGVVLSGYQDDGAAGLLMIKRCGGIAVVLDPATAEVPSMPQEAIARTETVDFILAAPDIPAVLEQLTTTDPGPRPAIPTDIQMEAVAAERLMTREEAPPATGSTTTLVCPDCGGMLRELRDGAERRYRCRVGHTFTSDHLLQAMDDSVERAFWVAARTLRERADLLKRLAASVRAHGPQGAADFEQRAEEVLRQGRLLEEVLTSVVTARPGDAQGTALPPSLPIQAAPAVSVDDLGHGSLADGGSAREMPPDASGESRR